MTCTLSDHNPQRLIFSCREGKFPICFGRKSVSSIAACTSYPYPASRTTACAVSVISGRCASTTCSHAALSCTSEAAPPSGFPRHRARQALNSDPPRYHCWQAHGTAAPSQQSAPVFSDFFHTAFQEAQSSVTFIPNNKYQIHLRLCITTFSSFPLL